MRDEQEIRAELTQTLMHYTRLESKDTLHARAMHEKIRWIEWVLSEPTETDSMPPSDRGNGTPEAE